VNDARAQHFATSDDLFTIHLECTRSQYLLEMFEVFSLCLLGKQPVAPNDSSSVIPPIVSSAPHRAGHGYHPRKDDLVTCGL